MKNIRLLLLVLAMLSIGHATMSRAEDIDLYSGLGGAVVPPNVLIVFDNAANFSSSAAGSSCIIDGVATELSGTVGGIEQCAFYNVINSLPVGSSGEALVNIGMMVYNSNNIRDINNANCGGSDGGCLVVPLTPMTTSQKAPMLAWIKTWRASGGAGDGYIKSSGSQTAATMQEAWAYYAGRTGLSGRNYAGIQPTAGCGKNFVIFIGNSFSSSGTPGDGGSASPAAALNNAPGVTAAQKALITSTYATACGNYTFPTASHESKGFYADEWARYMYSDQADLYSTFDGVQNITTYTIGLIGPSCQAEYAATLNSMADVAGGKYFATNDYATLTNALLKILNEVQAVNSVFSSSSLPVSVNAQGTYLNQIYMGMFRPDAGGNPRWLGNLKQYQFIYVTDPNNPNTGSLQLGDSLGNGAISSAGTGFISPNAVSFWTCGGNPSVRACSPVADPTNGFWKNSPASAGGAYDLPDGELVEKGGVAQVSRLANLSSQSSRKLYTFCPSGSSCSTTLSDSSNAFTTSNTGIVASQFGTATTLVVNSIVRTGTTALVTTSTPHNLATGDVVTISGAAQNEYNGNQSITVNSATTFTIAGLPDYPTSPSQGAYTVNLHNAAANSISSITRSSSATSSANTETATVTTLSATGYVSGNSVQITGATPSDYSGIKSSITVTGTNTFTYPVTIYPFSGSALNNAFQAVISPYSRSLSSIVKSGSTATVTTAVSHGFHAGQTVTISGTGDSGCNTAKTISTIPSSTTFTFAAGSCGSTTGGSVSPSTTPTTLTTLSRTGTTVSATATATVGTSNAFANGDLVNITYISGTAPADRSAYVVSSVPITCSSPCTTFTYPISVTPALSASGTMQVALSGASASIPAGSVTRIGAELTTVQVAGVANTFSSGDTVDIATSGTVYPGESAYVGTWTITCPVACSTAFTFGPVALTPATPAAKANGAANITAYQASTPPAKDPLINWVRGADNNSPSDEKGPGSPVTVRPSLHGDVLHSRPIVINYGGTRGVIVYYGANDGVFRAINGNQVNPTGSSLPAPGSELWGFIPTEFFGRLARQQTNSPPLKMPNTPPGISPTPTRKDYFVDGPTGVLQLMNTDGTTNTALLYLSMRRGGRLMYALDVSDPTAPKFLWKIDPTGLTNASGFVASSNYEELGETWSTPKVALVDGYSNPVLIFGAGYDAAEDNEPPLTDTMGRGIFILDAVTGALVWSATHATVAGMDYAIPADITLVDRDGNGKIDRLYAVDVGGNVWRVDLKPTDANFTPAYWQVNKLAALGCDSGVCASGSPRKFFYPVDVVTTTSYDAVIGGTGDREHPLFNNLAASVSNEIYMLKDLKPGNNGSGQALITRGLLFNNTCTTSCSGVCAAVPACSNSCGTSCLASCASSCPTECTTSCPTFTDNALASNGTTTPNRGYFITLSSMEKVVNAPVTVAGITYMGSNQATAPSPQSCTNLGNANAYQLTPLGGAYSSSRFAGGGLPPSPVAGLVNITTQSGEEKVVPFIIGGGSPGSNVLGNSNPPCVSGPDCESAFGGGKPPISVPTTRTRTYWYRKVE